ncbi:MAG: NAD(P)-dependent dehydrogenase (short-subunit alcohol dehydrogenase family) [Paracoccaceae bacterium]|jgi:NAD(P)-dependent dehydrogenase (short-subunit alcohol dehydrogenase family)
MDLGLKDQVAVVTGGSSGIGLATVRALLAEGCNVALCARTAETLDTVGADLAAEFGADRVLTQALSVLDPDALAAFADAVQSRFGAANVLINNAGQGRVSTFATTTDEDWRQELDLKFFSQIYPVRAFQDQLKSSGTGAIIGVNSLLAYQPEPHMVCTSAARAGVQNLLKSLANELAPSIRVNSILLGVVISGQWERRFHARADQTQSRDDWYADQAAQKHIPLGRFGTPQEAAKAITFLASPAASYITGARLELSGGTSRFV